MPFRWRFWAPRQRAPTEAETAEGQERLAAVVGRAMRDLLRSGRLSGGGIGWNWNPMAFIGRRNQRAHQVDFSDLKTYSAAELLEILISTHPDISDAVWQFLRMADTAYTYTVKRSSGKPDTAGQRALEEAVVALESPGLSAGFQDGGGLGSKHLQALLTVLVRAAVCLEVEPTPNLRGIQDIHVLDPTEIEFRKDPDGRLVPWQRVKTPPRNIPTAQRSLWQGNYKRLDSPTIIWEALDPFPGDPYGREPLLPVLQVVFFEIQVLQDLQAVVHNQGYPRLEVEVAMDVVLKRIQTFFPHLMNDPKKLQAYLDNELTDLAKYFGSLEPDDTLLHWDNSKAKAVGVEGKGPMIDVKKLIEIIEARIATGCKTFLTLLSRHTGTAEGQRTTDALLYQKGIAGIHKVAARGWGRALTVALNLLGRQGMVEWTYEAPDMRTPDQQEKDFAARIANADRLLSSGALDEAGYYQYIFDRAPSAEDIERIREARTRRQAQSPPRGGDGNP